MRGATEEKKKHFVKDLFQPTRPLRGATDILMAEYLVQGISTHAPLAGRDDRDGGRQWAQVPISTHAPLAGRDFNRTSAFGDNVKFQPTRPLRGATVSDLGTAARVGFQPTRPLRGATPGIS